MSIFSRQARLPSFTGVPLDDLLAHPAWAEPFAAAQLVPASCDLVQRVDTVSISSPYERFSGNMPFMSGRPGIFLIQGQRLAVAVPDGREIRLFIQLAEKGRLMLTRSQALQIVFGRDGAIDGWTFTDMKVDTPEGKAFGDAVRRYITR